MANPLTEKVGPFPLFVYVGIGVVGVLLYHKYHSGSAASTATDSAATDSGATDASSTPSTDSGTGTVSWSPQFASPSASGQDVSSNLEWSIAGADYLAGIGVSPQAANAAVNAYVNGQPTTAAQQSLIDQIIQYLGNAPEGLIQFVNPPASPNPIVGSPVPQRGWPTRAPTPPGAIRHNPVPVRTAAPVVRHNPV